MLYIQALSDIFQCPLTAKTTGHINMKFGGFIPFVPKASFERQFFEYMSYG